MLVEVGDGLRVVRSELVLRDLVHPGADELAEQLPAGLATDRLRDHADRVLRLDEAEGHVCVALFASGGDGTKRTVGRGSDGIRVAFGFMSFLIDGPWLYANGRAIARATDNPAPLAAGTMAVFWSVSVPRSTSTGAGRARSGARAGRAADATG